METTAYCFYLWMRKSAFEINVRRESLNWGGMRKKIKENLIWSKNEYNWTGRRVECFGILKIITSAVFS